VTTHLDRRVHAVVARRGELDDMVALRAAPRGQVHREIGRPTADLDAHAGTRAGERASEQDVGPRVEAERAEIELHRAPWATRSTNRSIVPNASIARSSG
jgi:hypothetical protein